MLAHVLSCAVIGLDGVIIDIEVDFGQGLPHMAIVGLPDEAVKESRERVYSAIKNANLAYPRKPITVNLAPASVRKEGPSFDLPIAVGVLIAGEQITQEEIEGALVVGELSLDGSVRHVRGVLAIAATARQEGFKRLYVPAADAAEAALIPDLEVIPIGSLAELYAHLTGEQPILPAQTIPVALSDPPTAQTDFSEIKGQEHVKRALEVAAAGGHNVLMSGPPGAGKTLLARAITSILPPLSLEEALEVTKIYSISDMLPSDTPLMRLRPFRAPHHTISHAGLVGGGNMPHPGEISLAHRGVLFLDELPEFGQRILEVLRQPIEDKRVTISRANGTLTFPANFMLIGAMNPCPCGYYGDTQKQCTCSPGAITTYQKRISGPLLDRIDMLIHVPRVEYQKLSSARLGESSADIRQRVIKARERQAKRFAGTELFSNADMTPAEVRQYCVLDAASQALMQVAMRQMQLTARGYHRVLKLARTIADLADCEAITQVHLAEALQYRAKEFEF
ncbi:MAG TPA: YifB family Mg chelatase-like AAA ATPase [Anaerolineaceae bacterium]|nr:magnesium chelatase [Anaerolineaceae bacterium]HOV30484.1 YifB family Mg chelatase-like AAA ATPase [Anaerolineaceae bacterium]HUM49016.1 YifB family Mg chelatase-like AAA ATPase [Anaerolineaceae bacterium]